MAYGRGMARTNTDIDDDLVSSAMRTFGVRTKREAVHLALERLPGGGPMRLDEQLSMEGAGWDGDLDAMRSNRFGGCDNGADS